MRYHLFLDDLRDPKPIDSHRTEVKVARTVEEAQMMVRMFGTPESMSLDHDLGEGQSDAPVFLKWLIEQHLDGIRNLDDVRMVIVHSANGPGAQNLIGLWNGFAREFDLRCKHAVYLPRA